MYIFYILLLHPPSELLPLMKKTVTTHRRKKKKVSLQSITRLQKHEQTNPEEISGALKHISVIFFGMLRRESNRELLFGSVNSFILSVNRANKKKKRKSMMDAAAKLARRRRGRNKSPARER